MKKTWAREVGQLGYRRPVKDGNRGGNDKFDVYLKDLGAKGYYGYCAKERLKPGTRWMASGYCVLDNNFSRAEFGAKPVESLKVTAAHEFFHAIQYAYDYAEDGWIMEATATWMEERVADDVNDNRQYLPHGQVAQPGEALDLFNSGGLRPVRQLGVLRVPQHPLRQGHRPQDLEQRRRQLPQPLDQGRRQGAAPAASRSPRSFARTPPPTPSPAGATPRVARGPAPRCRPAAPWRPGPPARRARSGSTTSPRGTWPSSRATTCARRRGGCGSASTGPSGRPARLPSSSSTRRTASSRRRRSSSTARVTASRRSSFSKRSVKKATVTFANASRRYNCWEQQLVYSCQGVPLDQGKRFGWKVKVFKR